MKVIARFEDTRDDLTRKVVDVVFEGESTKQIFEDIKNHLIETYEKEKDKISNTYIDAKNYNLLFDTGRIYNTYYMLTEVFCTDERRSKLWAYDRRAQYVDHNFSLILKEVAKAI